MQARLAGMERRGGPVQAIPRERPEPCLKNYLVLQQSTMNRIAEQHNQWFKEESARINKWAEDMLVAAQKELDDVRLQLKAKERQMDAAETDAERLSLTGRRRQATPQTQKS